MSEFHYYGHHKSWREMGPGQRVFFLLFLAMGLVVGIALLASSSDGPKPERTVEQPSGGALIAESERAVAHEALLARLGERGRITGVDVGDSTLTFFWAGDGAGRRYIWNAGHGRLLEDDTTVPDQPSERFPARAFDPEAPSRIARALVRERGTLGGADLSMQLRRPEPGAAPRWEISVLGAGAESWVADADGRDLREG